MHIKNSSTKQKKKG